MTRLSNRPLGRSKEDRDLFVGRDAELHRIVRGTRNDLNSVVVGASGSGKTSLCAQVAHDLVLRGFVVIPVNAALADSVEEFVNMLSESIGVSTTTKTDKRQSDATAAVAAARHLILELEELSERHPELGRVVFVVDDLRSERVLGTFFGALKDFVWRSGAGWVVAVDARLRAVVERPPVSDFFEQCLVLEPLDQEAAAKLLVRRAPNLPAEVIRAITERDDRYPRDLVRLLRQLSGSAAGMESAALLLGNVHTAFEAEAARDAAIAEVGRSAAMLAAEMQDLGPVSASDERLLSRLGWTRSRAAQVLSELEKRGLVESFEERGAVGRPRKLYQLKTVA